MPFAEMMSQAERGGYAVGYFEPWNVESLFAVLRGAEDVCSPVMVGLSGIFLPTMLGGELRHFAAFARAGRLACESAQVPVAYLFNETPYWEWALASLELGFNVTMYSNPADDTATHIRRTVELVERASAVGVAVQSELDSILDEDGVARTEPEPAAKFVQQTGVAALGVSAGNRHVRTGTFELDLELIKQLGETVPVPLVLHGGSGARDEQLRAAIHFGVRQINYGAAQRQAFMEQLTVQMSRDWRAEDPHLLLGTGYEEDIMQSGLEAVSALVAAKCAVLESSGQA